MYSNLFADIDKYCDNHDLVVSDNLSADVFVAYCKDRKIDFGDNTPYFNAIKDIQTTKKWENLSFTMTIDVKLKKCINFIHNYDILRLRAIGSSNIEFKPRRYESFIDELSDNEKFKKVINYSKL